MKQVSEHIYVNLEDGTPQSISVDSFQGQPDNLLDLAYECLRTWAGWRGVSVSDALREVRARWEDSNA